ESGFLTTPIGITNTHAVGVVRDALVAYAVEHQQMVGRFLLPVVAETCDARLNDIDAFHVTQQHAFEALDAVQGGSVEEGCVGGGTGMICHGFKAGIGTSSRLVECPSGCYTVGALVQTNHGSTIDLRVDGIPVGRELARERDKPRTDGSIIIIVATDAP